MNDADFLSNLYPRQGTIPPEFELGGQVNKTEYLLDGELRQWDGPLHAVTSPVCVETGAGCKRVVDSNDVVHSSTHSSSDTQNPATPAMIWLRVSVERNVPIASSAPPCSSKPR